MIFFGEKIYSCFLYRLRGVFITRNLCIIIVETMIEGNDTYKDIHIGGRIKYLVQLKEISLERICAFIKCDPLAVQDMYLKKSLDSDILLRWSKLLEYNLFMFYSAHLQIYAPNSSRAKISSKLNSKDSVSYNFKKNLYTPEVKKFILNQVLNKDISPHSVIAKYQIPKTTLYRWLRKENHDLTVVSKANHEIKKKSKGLESIIYKDKVLAYQNIYLDLIHSLTSIDPKTLNILKDKVKMMESYQDILEINNLIRREMGVSHSLLIEEQNLKAYDETLIQKILNEQERDMLSNRRTAMKYKMSRNTLAKWKRIFNEKNDT